MSLMHTPTGQSGPRRAVPRHFETLGSRLTSTAVIAGVLIVAAAVVGLVVAATGLAAAGTTAIWVAAGVTVVGLVAAARGYLLARGLTDQIEDYGRAVEDAVLDQRPRQPERQQPERRQPEQRATEPAAYPSAVAPAFTEGFGQWGEVFRELSGRLQSLVHRLIKSIDAMEFEIEDPDLQAMLFQIDHYATLARRQIENIAVLGGDELQRRANVPVEVNAVLRASVAEIQRYRQVTWIPMNGEEIQGSATAEVIHLLSELLDNATRFSPDDAPKVTLRAQRVSAGLELQIRDRGIGVDDDEMRRINRLLRDTSQVDVAELFRDGRIGLAVVKELASRHGIGVQLELNIFHGTDASVVLPHSLLSPSATEPTRPTPSPRPPQPPQPTPTQPTPDRAARHHRPEPSREAVAVVWPEEEDHEALPVLPVRQRGEALADLRDEALADRRDEQPPLEPRPPELADPDEARPPLPQRRDRATHLPPQLLRPATVARPIPGHDADLMADLQEGRDAGLAAEPVRHRQDHWAADAGSLGDPDTELREGDNG